MLFAFGGTVQVASSMPLFTRHLNVLLVFAMVDQIVVRNVNIGDGGDGGAHGTLGTMLREWESVGYGFVNYFGLQRFGNQECPTHCIGRELLKHNWDAVRVSVAVWFWFCVAVLQW